MSTIKSSNEHLTLNADGSGKDIKFQSNGSEVASISDGGVVTATSYAGSGANLTGISSVGGATGVDFNDNVKIRMGTSNDLEILHSGSQCNIDNDTGNLLITSVGTINLQKGSSEYLARFHPDGAAELYYDNSKKLETTATGTTVTRGLFTNGIEITDGSTEDSLKISASSQAHNLCKWVATNSRSANDHQSIMQFYRESTLAGRISIDDNDTQYLTTSDYRMKENVDYTWDATTRLKQLKPARYNWISDDTNTLIDGFLAHEVSSVVPNAVSGVKDAVDSDGNIDAQGIDQSKLVPLLVKTIQELEARITALES